MSSTHCRALLAKTKLTKSYKFHNRSLGEEEKEQGYMHPTHVQAVPIFPMGLNTAVDAHASIGVPYEEKKMGGAKLVSDITVSTFQVSPFKYPLLNNNSASSPELEVAIVLKMPWVLSVLHCPQSNQNIAESNHVVFDHNFSPSASRPQICRNSANLRKMRKQQQ